LFDVEIAVRQALEVGTPPPPIDAIRSRARAITAGSATRFRIAALSVLLLSLAGLGFAAAEHATFGTAPLPVASMTPAPSET
jgi:hypothetical protein